MNQDELDAKWQVEYEAACQADMDGWTDAEAEVFEEEGRRGSKSEGWLRRVCRWSLV